jgi:hypothetical protein
MSDLTNLLESIKNGELSVVAQKLVDMQSTITAALTQIASLQLEVEGTGLIPPGSASAVGVIHSPSRATSILSSREMFIGNYYVGDLLTGGNVATFYFGASSPCFLYFNPTDANHAVNKKYVDQNINPIASTLGTFISRSGDICPIIPDTPPILPNQFIFNGTWGADLARWLINGPEAAPIGSTPPQALTDFNTSVGTSVFYLNVTDARYYGSTTGNDLNLMTFGACNTTYLNKTQNIGINTLMPNYLFDSTSRLTWHDTRTASTKTSFELATIQNVLDLASGTITTTTSGTISFFSFSTVTTGTINVSSGSGTNFIPAFFTNTTPTQLVCAQACYLEIDASLVMRGNNGGPDGTIYYYKLDIHKVASGGTVGGTGDTTIKSISAQVMDLGVAPGCEYGSKAGIIIEQFNVGDILYFNTSTNTNDASANNCEVNLNVLAGGVAMPAPTLFGTQHDVLSSRTLGGGPYPNTTGLPMAVSVLATVNSGPAGTIILKINGSQVCANSGGATWAVGVSGIVPPGANYQILDTSTGITILTWVETY